MQVRACTDAVGAEGDPHTVPVMTGESFELDFSFDGCAFSIDSKAPILELGSICWGSNDELRSGSGGRARWTVLVRVIWWLFRGHPRAR